MTYGHPTIPWASPRLQEIDAAIPDLAPHSPGPPPLLTSDHGSIDDALDGSLAEYASYRARAGRAPGRTTRGVRRLGATAPRGSERNRRRPARNGRSTRIPL